MRIGPPGAERPAVLGADGTPLDLSAITPDIDGAFLSGGGVERARAALTAGHLRPAAPPQAAGGAGRRVGAPVATPGKIIGIGLNYTDHAARTGAAPPTEPIVFIKPSDTVVGPDDDVLIPRGSSKTDHEVELAVVIGRTARYLADCDEAAGAIAGYTIANDVTEREFQFERGGQWDKGKSCETFTPLGPWLVTPDEVGDVTSLGLRLTVNGTAAQEGTTRDMIFGVHHLVRYLSRFMALRPGDVVITGTPAGVAMGSPDRSFLRPGDVMELEVDGLGRQRQRLVAA
ncbi:2-keto-4-pentenoate hydratase/2-oxohepta-3-ene-1,7-dioic acid hydratase in catechol pathway [Nocardiopsis mwathae]|uniref:2-keto-4-pentenoate hydratase/2-oxohepta-3-ene-1,7-dioic acid hydratase in catechol pathway n=1 Tax=Nocardiopsis mwathae TaxID=1472723 RepID=A0A7W9YHF2_9ACTN|nr:fumarylacetoacetate hydrolase family protein [Nocardiopsis mwathae]MBB6172005.1 2-keto-4-pentenoate hydratase/2-oxohepta-3-ene-1,7-dioic acid hydratase in catechol pathway [Nocardiopsis mwathae]